MWKDSRMLAKLSVDLYGLHKDLTDILTEDVDYSTKLYAY